MPPADPDAKIQCPSVQHLQAELDALGGLLALGEKEETWEKLEKGLIRFAGITRGGGYKHLPLFVDGIGRKGVGPEVVTCMMSDRGRLSGTAMELLQTFAPRLGSHFQPLVHLYMEPLIRLLGRPNKVVLKRAEKCLHTIITHCQLPSLLPELRRGLFDDAATCRRGCASGFERAIKEWDRSVFASERDVGVVEEALRKMGTDKDVEVRAIAKRVFKLYSEVWPERVDDFSAPLTPTIRRYLDISAKSGPSKPKPAARPQAPPIQARHPAPVGLPEVHHDRLHHSRLNAIGGKASRPPPASLQPAAAASETLHQPLGDHQHPPIVKDTAGPALIRVTRNDPSQDRGDGAARQAARPAAVGSPAEPPYPGSWHVRSASHTVLPTVGSSSSLFAVESTSHSAMGHPARPALPSSFSTSALAGADYTAASGPARRFPPPARRLQVPAEDDDFASADHGAVSTPGLPLRGAARPVLPPHMPIKRPLGQAQRRVVTAPLPSSSSEGTLLGHAGSATTSAAHSALPLNPRLPALSVRDRVQELERNSPQKHDLSPRSKSVSPAVRAVGQSTSPVSSPLAKRVQERQLAAAFDSPVVPVLARSTNRHVREEEDGDLLHEPAPVKPHLIPLPGSPNSLFDNSFAQDREEPEPLGVDEPFVSAVDIAPVADANDHEPSTTHEEAGGTQPRSEQEQMTAINGDSPETSVPYDEAPGAREETAVPIEPTPIAAAEQPIVEHPIVEQHEQVNVLEAKQTVAKKAERPAASRPASAMSTLNTRQAPAAPALMKKAPFPRLAKTSKAPLPEVRLPPSAAARKPVGRVVSAPERRPFKPTSQTTTAKTSTLTAPTAATAARVTASATTAARPGSKATDTSTKAASQAQLAKAPAAPAAIQASSAPSRAPPAATSSCPAPAKPEAALAVPRSRVASGGFAAPTQASASRTGPATSSTANKPAVTGKVALPPAPRVKVTLKPPVPKFVPKSTMARGAAGTGSEAKLASSTTSSLRGSTRQAAGSAPAAKGPIRARVKPQNMPPPMPSREERAQLPAQDIPLPSSPRQPSPRSLRPESAASQEIPGSPSSLMLSDKQRGLVGVTAKYRPKASEDEVVVTQAIEDAETIPTDGPGADEALQLAPQVAQPIAAEDEIANAETGAPPPEAAGPASAVPTDANDGSRPPSPLARADDQTMTPSPAPRLNAMGLPLPPSRSPTPVGKTSTQPAMSDSGLDTDDELAGVSFSRSASGNVLAVSQDVQVVLPERQVETEPQGANESTMDFDEDIIVCVQAKPHENKENDHVAENEKGRPVDAVQKPGQDNSLSPRVALTQKDANAVRPIVDIVV